MGLKPVVPLSQHTAKTSLTLCRPGSQFGRKGSALKGLMFFIMFMILDHVDTTYILKLHIPNVKVMSNTDKYRIKKSYRTTPLPITYHICLHWFQNQPLHGECGHPTFPAPLKNSPPYKYASGTNGLEPGFKTSLGTKAQKQIKVPPLAQWKRPGPSNLTECKKILVPSSPQRKIIKEIIAF